MPKLRGRVGFGVTSPRGSSSISMWASWLCTPPRPQSILKMGMALLSISSPHTSRGRELLLGGHRRLRNICSKGPQEKQCFWVCGPGWLAAPFLNASLVMRMGFPLHQLGPPMRLGVGLASVGMHWRRGEHMKNIRILLGRVKYMLAGQSK